MPEGTPKAVGLPGGSGGESVEQRAERQRKQAQPKAPRKQRGKLSAARQVERDANIIDMKLDGLPWNVIAERADLSVNACRDVYRNYLRDPQRGFAIENAREI